MLDRDALEAALKTALVSGGDFAEVFVERKNTDNLKLEDGKIESFTTGIDAGAGLRVILGEATYFTHTDIPSADSVIAAAKELADAVRARQGATAKADLHSLRKTKPLVRHPVSQSPGKQMPAAKAELARRADEAARQAGREIVQVTVSLADSTQEITVANSEGLFVSDKRTLTRIFALAIARRADHVESGYEAPGIHGGYELFVQESPEEVGRKAAGRALKLLEATAAPTGEMPVILGGGSGGVLFHEACGHGLEADAVRKGASVFTGRIGEKVGADCVTAADDPSLPNRWVSFGVDDEGTPAAETLVIKNGVLKRFLCDRLNARLVGLPLSPNGRRQSFRHIPVPRMTNTYIKPGRDSFDTMLAGIGRGFYAKALGGGEVNPATGDYVFGVTEGYLIENGKVTKPVRGAVLVGNGPRTLMDIELVGTDLDFDAGMCGKAGQSVPVGTGQPSLRIRGLTIGGTGV